MPIDNRSMQQLVEISVHEGLTITATLASR